MRVILIAFVSVVGVGPISIRSQSLWTGFSDGLSTSGPRVFVEDTLSDALYVGGASFHAGSSVTSPGIFKWNGEAFEAMGCGFNWDCSSQLSNGGMANPILALAMWNGDLYAGGGITSASGVPIEHVARWTGSEWEQVGSGLNGTVTRLKVYSDGLYAVGYFNLAGDVVANGLARWDGTIWSAVEDHPLFGPDPINLLNDMAIHQGRTYVGGNFGGGNGLNDIAYHDGNEWRAIGNGFLGVFSTVNVLELHDDLLYVAGSFADYPPNGNAQNPGSGILTWDGENWAELGEGTRGAGNPSIYGMTWIRDTLYVTGRFDRIGGVATGRVARWDGERWCSLVPPDHFYPDIAAVGSFRDTLIVGGSFVVAGPDSINRIAKWVGGSYTSACSDAVGIPEPDPSGSLVCYPNPANDQLHISIPGLRSGSTARLFDATGRLVLSETLRTPEQQLAVSALPEGSYVLRVDGGLQARVVIMR